METTLDVEAAVLATHEKRELVKLLEIKEKFIQAHRIYWYSPLSHQAKFHASIAHIKMAFGSNRSGKTLSSVIDDIAFALGFKPWLLTDEQKKKNITFWMANLNLLPPSIRAVGKVPNVQLIIEDDWDVADQILLSGKGGDLGALKKWLPKESVECWVKNAMGYDCEVHLRNGSTIKIDTEKSFENNPGSFEGPSWDRVHYDEPKKEALRIAVKRGLVDVNGYEVFSLTPLAEAWMKDKIYDKAAEGTEIEAFFYNYQDNPHISKEGYQAFIDTLSEIEKEARVEGKWVHLKGLVYPEFIARPSKDEGNICEPITVNWVAENASLYLSIDPHPRQAQTVLFLAATKDRLIIYDEIFLACLLPEFCSLIKSKLNYFAKDKFGAKLPKVLEPVTSIIDPIAFNEDPVDGRVWASTFFDNGIIVEPAPKRKEDGILATRFAFKEKKLFICKNCTRTIYELQHYVYAEWRDRTRGLKERTVDKDDHAVECLYRLVLINPVRVDSEVENRPVESYEECPTI